MSEARVVIAQRALRSIAIELARADPLAETGGILLGAGSVGGVPEIRHAGTPGPAAVKTADFFLRDLSHAQEFADEKRQLDGSGWVGEWHSHPSGPPSPSVRDCLTYRDLTTDDGLDFGSGLISVIAFIRGGAWSLTAWRYTAHRLEQLTIAPGTPASFDA